MRSKLIDRISRLEHLEETASQPRPGIWHPTPEEKRAVLLIVLKRFGMADAVRDLNDEELNLVVRRLAEDARRQKMSEAWDSHYGPGPQ